MGCGPSQVKKTERSNSQVTIESQQRTVAAYRRQRIARDMEQIASLRAEAEVEKALMLKRSSLGSVDDRRPSYVMRVLEDLAEVEEGQEELEEKYSDPVILNGTYHNEKLVEQAQHRNERNIALHSSVTQPESVTPEKVIEEDSDLNKQEQVDELTEDQIGNDWDIALHNSVTQESRVTPEEEQEDKSKLTATHAQENDENVLNSAESNEKSSMDTSTRTKNNEETLKPISELEIRQEDEREGSGGESQMDTILNGTAHVQENTPKTDHNLTNHDREEAETERKDQIENELDVTDEDLKKEKESEVDGENELVSQGMERNGLQDSTDFPDISKRSSNS